MNELLILLSVVGIYGTVLFVFKGFGKEGLIAWVCVGTILANLEVTIALDAFGFSQTLGNILFASTFLATDLLSEHFGKKYSSRAVSLSVCLLCVFLALSFMWLNIVPNELNTTYLAFQAIFSSAIRVTLASLTVFIVAQKFDVWVYHKVWSITEKRYGREKFLWVRNNASTLCSQLINNILFTLLAFYGVMPVSVLIGMITVSFILSAITSLLDTPIMYLSKIKIKGE